jgi:hypothetical protein
MLQGEQIDALLEKTLSITEWTECFIGISNGTFPDWLPNPKEDPQGDVVSDLQLEKLSVLSPTKGDGIFDFLPTLSFDSDESMTSETGVQKEWRALVSPAELLVYTDNLNNKIKKIKAGWPKPFLDIESGYQLLIEDLKVLHKNMSIVQAHLGQPAPIKGLNTSSIWDALTLLGKAIQDVEEVNETLDDILDIKIADAVTKHPDFQQLVNEVIQQRTTEADISARLVEIERLLTTHHERLRNIRQVIQGTPNHSSALGASQLSSLEARLALIEQTISTWANSAPGTSLNMDKALDETLGELKEEVRLLKQRVVGAGITIGSQVFQSYEDFAIWVKTGVPAGRFGLFVDGHSLLDFFSFVGFLDAESVANSFHSSNKSGFKSMLETRVAASMQNFFPAPFGKTASDKIDDSETLPGIPDPDKFDNGSTGVRYKILRGMKDVSAQLESNIDKVLRDYPDARQMARDLLLNAKRFVIDLLNFMSQDYNSWKLRGYTKREAWKMTCRSVHRVLDDLQGARMTGRDAGDGADIDRVTATYIWATAKTHEVMDEYLKFQFFEHPALAAVLARHLAASAVLPDDSLASKLDRLDTKLTKLSAKVDGLESKINYKPQVKFADRPSSPAEKNGGRGSH